MSAVGHYPRTATEVLAAMTESHEAEDAWGVDSWADDLVRICQRLSWRHAASVMQSANAILAQWPALLPLHERGGSIFAPPGDPYNGLEVHR